MHKSLPKLLLIASLAVAVVLAKPKPRFIAIPLEDVQLVEVEDLPGSSLVRVPRHIKSSDQSADLSADASRPQRQAHDHHEYVDFGAHTGHHGSFGWYADFPVKQH
ncbi:uncharacterized protein LOC111061907 [Nilaparvata lugens]|uniref:uncharacterized protein LOC111061907 n=1 Tax=Nilaparvata lugens TaxID=108931 RepID=UPI000B9827CC|nr:uncharacterized protein LOC111061907 [Nilaparvata lugens]